MLQLDNRTPFEAERGVFFDLDGSEIWVVAVKATFEVRGGTAVPAEKQEPVCMVDEYFGEAGMSSLKYESELVFRKPGTDVVIHGHVHAPGGRPTESVDAEAEVTGRRKRVRAHGDRFWRATLTGAEMTDPEPFNRMPLRWERAFGGVDLSDPAPEKQGAEYRNPIGTGFGLSASYIDKKAAPNLEDLNHPIRSWKDRPAPVGFGFVGRHWQPRIRYAGTCDDNYIQTRLPLLPVDFDVRYHLGASEDFAFIPHLKGGEDVVLRNFTPDGYLSFRLPRVALGFRTRLRGQWIDHFAQLGTVVIEPDHPRVLMVWQTFLACHRKKFELEVTRVYEKRVVY